MGAVGFALAFALVAAPATNSAKKVDSTKDPKVVCRQVTEAGTRIPFRMCRTEAEWEQMAKQNQDDWTSSRNARTIGCNQPSCM